MQQHSLPWLGDDTSGHLHLTWTVTTKYTIPHIRVYRDLTYESFGIHLILLLITSTLSQ